jgi:hypothetical protein
VRYNFAVITLCTYPDLISRTRNDLRLLTDNGIRVSPSCRFTKYLRQLEAASRADGFTVPRGVDLKLWVRSLVELDDLHLIVSQLPLFPPVLGWQARVQAMLSGGTVRAEETKHSSGRDVQFELITAAMIREAGYRVSLDEPDVVVTSTVPRFGVAAKRPRRYQAVQANVEEAGRQIRKAEVLGIVALDITCLKAPDDPCLLVDDFSVAFETVVRTADAFIHRHSHALRERRKTPLAIGMAVHFALPVFVANSRQHRFAYARRLALSNWADLHDPRTRLLSNVIADMLHAERHAA